MKYDLSILIPARNEMFLSKTIEDILSNIEGNTEIIVGLDGRWAEPAVKDDSRVTLVYYPESIGQRAMTNRLCNLSTAKYVMKVDAHCAFDKGFDVKMMNEMQDNWTMIPTMRNLHVLDWVCKNGHRRYQGPKGKCAECGEETTMEIVWNPKTRPQSNSFAFDAEPHFQYFNTFSKRKEGKGDLTESMSIQGSCFMCTREKYLELNLCDEAFGSGGSEGIEVACKTWLSGGRVVVNHKTWYGHLFRTQGKDFGFPYDQRGSQVETAKAFAKNLFFNNKWEKQILPLSWLLEKFWPIDTQSKNPDNNWSEKKLKELKESEKDLVFKKPLSRGIIFYTDNQLNLKIAHKVQNQLRTMGLPIVSASLKPMPHFGKNICLPLQRGITTMFKQQLAALEASDADIIYFCEADVVYHPSHFEFIPEKRDTFYYNTNVWKVRKEDGHSLWVDNCIQVSGLVGYREELIKHYRERVALAEAGPWDRNWGYEPGTPGKTIFPTQFKQETWMSKFPNLDIRHDNNLTLSRWSPKQFRDKKNCQGWTEKNVTEIVGWNNFTI